MLKVAVVHVCAKNWHVLVSIILNFTITICSIFRKREINLHRIARNPKSATKYPILIILTCMLKVTVFHVCAKNWHGLVSIILNFTITICSIFGNVKLIFIPKSATKNPILIKLTSMLKVAVVHVCAKNWHGLVSIILNFTITICLIFRKREINLHRIARNPKSVTKNSMLIKLTCMLKVAVFHVYAKNWHRLLSIILNFTITICLIFRKREINLYRQQLI